RVAQWINLTLSCELASNWQVYSALSGILEFRVFLHGGERAFHVRGGNSRIIEALGRAHRGPTLVGARVVGGERAKGAGGEAGGRRGRGTGELSVPKRHAHDLGEARRGGRAVDFLAVDTIRAADR